MLCSILAALFLIKLLKKSIYHANKVCVWETTEKRGSIIGGRLHQGPNWWNKYLKIDHFNVKNL